MRKRTKQKAFMDKMRTIGYYPLPAFVVAQEKGLFARQQLEINFEIATFAPDHNRGMAEGRWDLSLTSPDSIYDLHRRKILRNYGLYETEYQVKIIGTSPFRLDALRKGEVSACMVAPPYDAQAINEGFNLLAQASDHIPDYPTAACWGRRSWAQQNRGKLFRFVQAFVEATDWLLMAQNREEALRLMQGYEGITREQAETKLARVIPKAAIAPSSIHRVVRLRIEMGLFDPPHDPIERFYDAGIWSEATSLPGPAPFGRPPTT